MRKVMVFGVFDGLHEGHRKFLHHAKQHGDYLIAVVTPDDVVYQLKGKLPDRHLGDRIEHLVREGLADHVVEGDYELGAWHVVRHNRPNVFALGYDQEHHLRHELENLIGFLNLDAEVAVMPAHKPQTHHSSLLRKPRHSQSSTRKRA